YRPLSAPVGRPLSGAGRHTRAAVAHMISCRRVIGRANWLSERPSRSISSAPRAWSARSSRAHPSPSASARTVISFLACSPVSGGAVAERGLGDEGLGPAFAGPADADQPFPLQGRDQPGELV